MPSVKLLWSVLIRIPSDKLPARVAEFEDGVKRGIEEYKTGQVKTSDDKAKFLKHLRSL